MSFQSASRTSQSDGPAWRVALFYPEQGGWTEADYLGLPGGPLVEYDHGCVEILDMPTKEHQRIVQFLFMLLQNYVQSNRCGEAFIAPLPVRLWAKKYREPDVLFLDSARSQTGGYPDGADLVMEVVSEGTENRRRDTEVKLQEYAQAGIAEYWIIDPEDQSVSIHHLAGTQYIASKCDVHCTATSRRLPGLEVAVADVIAAGRGPIRHRQP